MPETSRLKNNPSGDVVLREILPLRGESHRKWASNYRGPYIAKRAFSSRALVLKGMNEKI